ncbi:MAG: hypothetical protein RIT24_1355 [Planctomycetota bacterium]
MRILQVTHGFPPESVGGVEQHVDGLSAALARRGEQVHVYARTSDARLAQGERRIERSGNPAVTRVAFRWESVGSLEAMYRCAPMADALRTFLRERKDAGEGFDVAHVHHLTGMSVDSLDVLRDAGIPSVLTLHDYWLMCPRGQMWHRREEVCEKVEASRCGDCLSLTFRHWVAPETGAKQAASLHDRARQTLAKADRLVIPSARAIPPFAALGIDASRITVVENGVDTESLRELPAPSFGPGPLRLGYLGTVMPSKGLHVLLDAVLRQPPGSVELHIFGNAVPYHGDESYLTRCFQRLTSTTKVVYHGPYTTAMLPAVLGQLDVVCAPALWHEAFGLTVREALAAGRPILVSRVGGLQDAVEDGREGRLLPPGDVAAWSEAIRALAEDRGAARAMAARTRTKARGFAAMAEDLLAVYRSVRPTTR